MTILLRYAVADFAGGYRFGSRFWFGLIQRYP